MTPFDFRPRTRILFGSGEFARLGEVAREHNATRCLLLADQAMVSAGYAQEAIRSLKARRMEVFAFHEFEPNPTVAMVDAAREYAAPHNVNLIVGLGGGSALDFTKAVNVVIANGGSLRDYWGYGNVPRPLLPMIAVPTTAGAGSEAQSNMAIVDPEAGSHGTPIKMTSGDPKVFFRAAILDPKLTLSQPDPLTAASGYDAISHAIETLVSTKRTPISECYSREGWRLLDANFERVLRAPEDIDARGAMLLGSAVEWLGEPSNLVRRLGYLAEAAGLPRSLHDASVPEQTLPRLAEEAAAQWTSRFSSRPFDAEAALEIYHSAY